MMENGLWVAIWVYGTAICLWMWVIAARLQKIIEILENRK